MDPLDTEDALDSASFKRSVSVGSVADLDGGVLEGTARTPDTAGTRSRTRTRRGACEDVLEYGNSPPPHPLGGNPEVHTRMEMEPL
eukprot:CAMPEP_0119140062 /NCGR_PEP_ID=MMETSP1310-20130426/28606_1 /TAXON_ID=464262 /ORGANISM="Genus nov. species nov., Strain RCC2339" /LENGTH=85 /DNA_ID=CAMNT_0007131393 /DNA_START=135 /DNA_END=389 /DNA_ORIENTATION=+